MMAYPDFQYSKQSETMSKQRPIYKLIGAKIKARRKGECLSQVELAGLCNLSQTFISQIEKGQRGFTVDTFHIIAQSLNTTMSDLLKDL